MKKNIHFAIVMIVALLAQFMFLSAQTWSGLKQLTWNSDDSHYPSIATDSGSYIYVVWEDLSPGNYEIYFKKSSDSGTSWSAPTRMTWNSAVSRLPVIAAEANNNIYVVWNDGAYGNWEIFFKRSADKGVSWSATSRLTWNIGRSGEPAITIDASNNIHLVWDDQTPGNKEIFYRKSTNGGSSWGTLKRLTWNSGHSWQPRIATDSGSNIYVAWKDLTPGNNEIFLKSSTNSGNSWSTPKRLTWNAGDSSDVDIAVDSAGNIRIVWQDDSSGNQDIYYKSSTNSGSSWSAQKRLTWTAAGFTLWPKIAVDSNSHIHSLWLDSVTGKKHLYMKHSTDGGTTWSALERLTWKDRETNDPDLIIDLADNIHVVLVEDYLNYEIYYKNRK